MILREIFQDNSDTPNSRLMHGATTLSRRERRYYFFYLLLLLLITLVILSFVFIGARKKDTVETIAFEVSLLQQHNYYIKKQDEIYPFLERTFNKINEMRVDKNQAFIQNDIQNDISNISAIQNNAQYKDPRFEDYKQVALFFKMFFNDKIKIARKNENVALFEKQFADCSIGYKEKEQQLVQKKALSSARIN